MTRVRPGRSQPAPHMTGPDGDRASADRRAHARQTCTAPTDEHSVVEAGPGPGAWKTRVSFHRATVPPPRDPEWNQGGRRLSPLIRRCRPTTVITRRRLSSASLPSGAVNGH